MTRTLSRRTLSRAAAIAIGAASTRYAAPAVITAQGADAAITWWSVWPSGPQNEFQQRIVDDFNAQANGVSVTLTVYPNYNELANAAIIALDAGEGPHIATLSESWWFAFYLRQSIHDLKDHVDQPDDYVQGFYQEYQRHGGQYCVPFARSTPLFYYNKTMLDAAGLDAGIFATWSDFQKAAPDLMKAGGAKLSHAFANVPEDLIWTMQGPAHAFGGQISDQDFKILIDSGENVAAANVMQTFVTDGSGAPVNNPAVDFGTGTSASTMLSTAYLGALQTMSMIEFGVMPLPKEVQAGCPTGGSGLGVLTTANDEQIAAAAEFLTYATSTGVTAGWGKTTG